MRLLLVLQHIEVARLMKSKPLDNMEFMQWMKSYVDGQTGGLPIDGYDGAARRAGSRTGDIRSGAPGRRRPVRPPHAARGDPLPVTASRSIINCRQPCHASGQSWETIFRGDKMSLEAGVALQNDEQTAPLQFRQ